MTPSVACLDIGSVAIGYVCLELASRLEIEIVEASVVGGARFQIFLRGSEAAVAEAVHAAQKSALAGGVDATSFESEVLTPEPPGLFAAMYSLAEQRLDESLIVCEAPSMSALFAAAGVLLATGQLRAIEIKALRGATAGALGFFTGPASACGLAAEGARARWKASGRSGRIECLDAPSEKFREYFNLDGRA